MADAVSVLLVDDHPVVRSGLRALLSSYPGLDVVGDAESGEKALRLLPQTRAQVVLCDLRLGDGLDGVDTTRRLRALPNPPAVVILTTYDHDADIIRAIEAGAAGYLLKDATMEEIGAAITEAAAGGTVLSAELTRRVVEGMRRQRTQLSARERDVLDLVAAGRSNRQIARQLMLSEATVKTHLVHVFGKLEVDNRTGAVARARELGMLT